MGTVQTLAGGDASRCQRRDTCHRETGNSLRRRSAKVFIRLRSQGSLVAKVMEMKLHRPRCEGLRLPETGWIRAHNIAASVAWCSLTCLRFFDANPPDVKQPEKVEALTKGGIEVIERIACEAPLSPYALSYLRTEKQKTGYAVTVV
jgi:hypothetical protein